MSGSWNCIIDGPASPERIALLHRLLEVRRIAVDRLGGDVNAEFREGAAGKLIVEFRRADPPPAVLASMASIRSIVERDAACTSWRASLA